MSRRCRCFACTDPNAASCYGHGCPPTRPRGAAGHDRHCYEELRGVSARCPCARPSSTLSSRSSSNLRAHVRDSFVSARVRCGAEMTRTLATSLKRRTYFRASWRSTCESRRPSVTGQPPLWHCSQRFRLEGKGCRASVCPFQPLGANTDAGTASVIISADSMLLAGVRVYSPCLPASVPVGANHAKGPPGPLCAALGEGNIAKVVAALSAGCSTEEGAYDEPGEHL